jgi:hypothetical protein
MEWVHGPVDQAHGYQLTANRIVKWSRPLNWWRKGTLLLISTVHQRLDDGGRLQSGAAALGLHGGAMAERGGSLEWRLVCATTYSFRRFWAQIKAGVEGSSPRGILDNGGHQKMACGSKGSALGLSNDGREPQGAVSTGSSPNGCSTTSASSSGSHRGPKHRREAGLGSQFWPKSN